MKIIIIKLIFTIIAMSFLFGMLAIAEVLSNLMVSILSCRMDLIMNVGYIVLGFCFIYLIRN